MSLVPETDVFVQPIGRETCAVPRRLLRLHVKPNTHRRRRRDETVLSRRVGVGGVYWALRTYAVSVSSWCGIPDSEYAAVLYRGQKHQS